jgi:hypothetical protein
MSAPAHDLDAEIEERATRLAEQIGHTWTDEQLAKARTLLLPVVRDRKRKTA